MIQSELIFKLFMWHFLITIASIFIFLNFIVYNNKISSISCLISFMSILLFYFLNGYFLTKEKVKWVNYFAIAFVGIGLWLFCFIMSPTSTSYKQNADSGSWFFYELYILARTPLNFIDREYSLKLDLFEKFIFPIIFSFCQYLGGLVKMKKF